MDRLPVAVRPAEPSDVEDLWPLVLAFAVSYRPDKQTFCDSFTALTRRPDTLVLVAQQPSRSIVGYLLAHSHGTFFANGPVAWVEEVMVAELVRRQGVGGALLAQAEDWAQSLGARYLALASRRAGAFYLEQGFVDSATFYKLALPADPAHCVD